MNSWLSNSSAGFILYSPVTPIGQDRRSLLSNPTRFDRSDRKYSLLNHMARILRRSRMGISGQASRNTDTKHHDADLTRRGKISRRPAAENRCDSRREHHAVCIHSQAESIPGRVLCMPFQKYEYATGFSVCRRTAFYRETAESPGICDTVIESVPSRRARTSKTTHQLETNCALSRRR